MRRVDVSKLNDSMPQLDENYFKIPQQNLLTSKLASTHPPRILMLYGSLRERSYSKLLTLEAAKLLEAMGAAYSGITGLKIMQAIPLTCAFEGGGQRGSNDANAR